MTTINGSTVKLASNVAYLGVYFPVVGGYESVVNGEEYPQCVRLVGGYVENEERDVPVYSWEAGDGYGVYEKGEWYDSLEEAVEAAREHIQDNDGVLEDHCG